MEYYSAGLFLVTWKCQVSS